VRLRGKDSNLDYLIARPARRGPEGARTGIGRLSSEAFGAALRALPNGPGTMMDHGAHAMMDASLAEAR
jgi:hypothetical protein